MHIQCLIQLNYLIVKGKNNMNNDFFSFSDMSSDLPKVLTNQGNIC